MKGPGLLHRACLLGLILLASVGLPAGLAWSAVHAAPFPRGKTRPVEWAQLIDKRLNLYRMQPGLYRSALPDGAAQPLLEALGVVTLINLHQASDADWLRDPRIRQVHLPLRTRHIDDADVIQVLRSIREAQANGPVLIHCKHGQDRTGLIAAMYRILYQGWSKAQALAEMHQAGFGGEDRLGNTERYLRQVDVGRLRAALDSGACSTRRWALCRVKAWLGEALENPHGSRT
ncbi:tyrosine-protein phosphatase [Pseudomonas sp. RIT-PI-AD]|uniref:phosphatase domain-containing protein n=1 Tax=Pseudomonas sp. RIT-PI-AD TaxID=3035294 RepID=UPI0021D9CFAB|nr:tyrosine-protein phosphatase [Pseudomonas sp. RIT-PI-AD]